MTYIKPLIAVLTALLVSDVLPFWAPPTAFGIVTSVTDGDTLWVRIADQSRKPIKVRLRGIDAPEICQAGGAEAKASLQRKVLHRPVRIEPVARDTYRRTVADVWIDGQDVGAWLVRNGQAWSYRFGRSKGPYSAEESAARAERLGVFADEAAAEPALFRKTHGSCDPTRRWR